jgi:hypothetical protein
MGAESRPSDGRRYFHCQLCDLVFVSRADLPGSREERERYLLHDNHPGDLGYRRFLSRMVDCLRPHLTPGAQGLDYGAGPSPVLASLLGEAGFPTLAYDPFFHPHPERLARTYDFVTCTEVAEHFHRPAEEFERLRRLIVPGGWLGVMTQRLEDRSAFRGWYYHRDPTHVCFYSLRTMDWIARRFGWRCQVESPDLVLFH